MIVVLLTLSLTQTAAAQETLQEWAEAIGPPPAALALTGSMSTDYGTLPVGLPARLSQSTRQTLARSATAKLARARTQCQSASTVRFMDEELPDEGTAGGHFLESTIHLESIFCLQGGSASQALEIYQSEHFKVSALPLVESVKQSGDRMCIQTSSALGGLLPPAHFCSQVQAHHGPDFHGQVGWLTDNQGGADHQTLYYRHYVVAFVDRPGGGVAGFRGVVTRGRDLNTLQRSVIRATASKGHDMMQAKLSTMLTGP